MGLFSQALGLGGSSGPVDPGGGVDRSDKEQKRKHYEKQEKEQTPEERERAKPPPPKDGKVY